jgi:hypothetical protein
MNARLGPLLAIILAIAVCELQADAVLAADSTPGTAGNEVPDSPPTVNLEADPDVLRFEDLERASGRQIAKRYMPPPGLGSHAWGDRFTAFERLNPSPVTLELAYAPGRVSRVETLCPPIDCSLERALLTLHQKASRNGFTLFAEFVVPGQGFRFKSTGVLMYPVTYQFCTGWPGESSKPPADITTRLQLCGVRLVFKSQTRTESDAMEDEQLTNYELIFHELMREFGKPDRYLRLGRVTIHTAEGEQTERRKRNFRTWRWCAPIGMEFATACTASIVFGFNPESGNGVVMYSTPEVWNFAYNRDLSVQGHDPMYRFMHAQD